jgi:hypothetical protein
MEVDVSFARTSIDECFGSFASREFAARFGRFHTRPRPYKLAKFLYQFKLTNSQQTHELTNSQTHKLTSSQAHKLTSSPHGPNRYLSDPSPCLFERLKIWPFHTVRVRSVGKAGSAFSGRTFCQLASQKDAYQSAISINRIFWGAKSLSALKRHGLGSDRCHIRSTWHV